MAYDDYLRTLAADSGCLQIVRALATQLLDARRALNNVAACNTMSREDVMLATDEARKVLNGQQRG